VIGTDLLLDQLANGLSAPVPQVGEPTYAAKIDAEELHLDWSQPAEQLARVVRLGRAWTEFRGRRLRVLRGRAVPGSGEPGSLEGTRVAAGEGALELLEVQPEGKGAMPAADWVRGAHPAPGERLGP
jgi:methionyl-tRNA formyltransferase